ASSPTTPRTPPRSRVARRPTFSQSSGSAAAPKWYTGMIWWSAGLSAQTGAPAYQSAEIMLRAAGAPEDPEKKRAGFRPEGRGPPSRRRRQPALGNAPTHSTASGAPEFHSRCRFSTAAHKGRPRRQKGPGSIAGWVRGWGLGALHPALWVQRSGFPAVPLPEIIFEPCPAEGGAGGARASGAPDRPAVRRVGHPETPDIANGCEGVPLRRRGPRRRSECRSGTGWGDRLQGNP